MFSTVVHVCGVAHWPFAMASFKVDFLHQLKHLFCYLHFILNEYLKSISIGSFKVCVLYTCTKLFPEM